MVKAEQWVILRREFDPKKSTCNHPEDILAQDQCSTSNISCQCIVALLYQQIKLLDGKKWSWTNSVQLSGWFSSILHAIWKYLYFCGKLSAANACCKFAQIATYNSTRICCTVNLFVFCQTFKQTYDKYILELK